MTIDLDAALAPILPMIGAHLAVSEDTRRPSREVMAALGSAGLLRLMVPQSFGGEGAHPRVFVEFTERLARVHGSLAWTAMTCNEEAGIASAYLDPTSMKQLYRDQPDVVVAGSGVPKGRAVAVDGGWLVTGRWPFVSGCTASDWVVLANLVKDRRPAALCFVLVPTSEVRIEDTWHTAGLRGTGSNDVVLTDHFVPDQWASGALLAPALARPDTPFYRLPSGLRFPFPKVGVAAGLAGAAITEFSELASGKRPLYSQGELRDRPTAQAALALAVAKLGSGRAWALEVVDELWATVTAGDPIPEELHARCRLASSHAVSQCIEAVEALASEAGSTANFTSSPLVRLANDVRAVAAHFMVAPYQKQTAGRLLLGLDADDAGF